MDTIDEHKALLKIAAAHRLLPVSYSTQLRKGQDADVYIYDELNSRGERIARYEVRESMSIYPPFNVTKSWKVVDGRR